MHVLCSNKAQANYKSCLRRGRVMERMVITVYLQQSVVVWCVYMHHSVTQSCQSVVVSVCTILRMYSD